MCSIFGYISASNTIDKPILEGLSSLMNHRGEDGYGYFSTENLFLGHNRLAIQDLSIAGNQPMMSDDNRYVLVFNGEIYNHLDLRKKLDRNFVSNCDTETLLYLLIQFGKNILTELNGIFTLAFYDSLTHQMLIARDVVGVKPLYYQVTKNSVCFASELKSIIQHPDFHKSTNVEALRNYLIYTYNPANTTVYNDVFVFPPASYAELNVLDIQSLKPIKYYSLNLPLANPSSEKELLKTLEKKLLEAIERQLIADVPIGVMLSGGLDSSAVLALAKTVNPSISLPCYSIVQPNLKSEGFDNDIQYARLVAKHFEQELYEINGKIKFDDLEIIAKHLEEPCADIAPLYVYRIAELAKSQGVKVLMSGAGADELWAGYRRHILTKYPNLINNIPDFVSHFAAKNLDKPFYRRIHKLVGDKNTDVLNRNLGYFKWHHQNLIDTVFNESFEENPLKVFGDNIDVNKNLLSNVLNCELNTYLPRHNLLYNDKMGMAHGVEIRVPLLDLELLKFSATIPSTLKIKGFTGKYLFRKVMENYLPKSIINRSKTGFGAPIRDLVKNDWKSNIASLPNELPAEIFNLSAINDLINDNQNKKVDASYALICLSMMKLDIR